MTDIQTPTLMLYGTRDGDVLAAQPNSSGSFDDPEKYGGPMRLFDAIGDSSPFRALWVIEGANHNQFNERWAQTDGGSSIAGPATISGEAQRVALARVASAWVDVWAHGRLETTHAFTGDARLAGMPTYRSRVRRASDFVVDGFTDGMEEQCDSVCSSVQFGGMMSYVELPLTTEGGPNRTYHYGGDGAFFRPQTSGGFVHWIGIESVPPLASLASSGFLTLELARHSPEGPVSSPGSALAFEVGVTYDDPETFPTTLLDSSVLAPINGYPASPIGFTILETLRVPLACWDGRATAFSLSGIGIELANTGAISRVAVSR